MIGKPGIRFSFADASFEVTAIRFGHQMRIIYEQDEFRRCEIASRFIRGDAFGRLQADGRFAEATRPRRPPFLGCVA